MAGESVLIVEDEPIVVLDMKSRLRKLGYQVVADARTGEEAVSTAKELRPDVVLMDIQLEGEMDGIDAAEEIRHQIDAPVIFVTANTDDETRARAKTSQASGYILKPFNEREIEVIIEMALSKHQADRELRRSREAALKAVKAQNEFVANMTHELRTPLNSIIGMAELLRSRIQDREAGEYLDILRQSSTTLLSIINGVLDFSKVEDGKMQRHERRFDLPALLSRVLDQVAVQAANQGLRLECELSPDCACELWGDEHKLQQILVNLLSNAVKFTEEGRVRLVVRRARHKGDNAPAGESASGLSAVSALSAASAAPVFEFEVSDTGIGIPAAQIEEVFRPFAQMNQGSTRKQGGTGIGLTLVREMVEVMGGTIELQSDLGAGSEARVRLAFNTVADPHEHRLHAALPERITSLHLLSASPGRIRHLAEWCELWGVAFTGHDSKEAILQALQTARPGAVLCLETGIPGYEALRHELQCGVGRESADGAGASPVLGVVTIRSIERDDRSRSFPACGNTRSVLEPLRVEQLRNVLTGLAAEHDTKESNHDREKHDRRSQHREGGRNDGLSDKAYAEGRLLRAFLEAAGRDVEWLSGDRIDSETLAPVVKRFRAAAENEGLSELSEHLFRLMIALRRDDNQTVRRLLQYVERLCDEMVDD